MIYTIYEPATGHITNNLYADSVDDLNNHLGGHTTQVTAIAGHYDGDEYYIQDGVAVAKTPKPGPEYNYNYTDHVWEINTVYLTMHMRIRRNQALSEIDAVSPVRYASLNSEQQADLQTYRQLLLDVPQQSDFPVTIDWPTRPTWL
jgi:hypothetical protein